MVAFSKKAISKITVQVTFKQYMHLILNNTVIIDCTEWAKTQQANRYIDLFHHAVGQLLN